MSLGSGFSRRLDLELVRELHRHATILQSKVWRPFIAIKAVRDMQAYRRAAAARDLDRKAATAIQTIGRMYLSRCAAVLRAQDTIVKYVDPRTEKPYWCNPNMQRATTWLRPKIFGSRSDNR